MIGATDITTAMVTEVNDNLKATLGLKTIVAHEPKYDKQTLAQLMPLAPFTLIRWVGLKPVESQRLANGASGMNRELISFVLGATSLLPDKAREGCLAMADAFRLRYDGFVLVIEDEGQVELALESADFLDSEAGLLTYIMVFSYNQN